MNPDVLSRGPQLDLNLVRVFVAIYETRSVTLAGDRLELTQPSVSHALARLRASYGDRLFVRAKEGLASTALGMQLYPALSEALARIEATLDETRSFHPERSTRRFRIAMSDIGALYFTPRIMERLQGIAPHVQVDVAQPTVALLEELRTGAVDLAVGNLPELLANTRTQSLFEEHYVCMVSEKHPWIRGELSIEEFARARHVLVTSPASGHALIDGVLASHGVVRNVAVRIPQFSVLPYLVERSDLLVIVPERVARLFVARGGLRSLPLPVPVAPFEVRMHWNARHQDSPGHQWLREQLAAALSGL